MALPSGDGTEGMPFSTPCFIGLLVMATGQVSDPIVIIVIMGAATIIRRLHKSARMLGYRNSRDELEHSRAPMPGPGQEDRRTSVKKVRRNPTCGELRRLALRRLVRAVVVVASNLVSEKQHE